MANLNLYVHFDCFQRSQDEASTPEIVDLVKNKRSLFSYSLLWAVSATLQYGYFPSAAGAGPDNTQAAAPLATTAFSLPLVK